MSDRKREAEYRIWGAMKNRCLNENADRYKDYGGRGITIDPRWLGEDGYDNFLDDMGRRPSASHTLERRKNDEGYSKENCVWATMKEQSRNRKSTRLIEYGGRTMCLKDWAKELGLGHTTLAKRLDSGWETHRAFTEPVRSWANV